ncbi:MAG: bifunctional adenosylcobinamide kinase/adenosylcobinamide-phosphate guanylyltransferase [Endomicrobiia bacterium]
MRKKIIFILGGIKSGKSSYAVERADFFSKKYNLSVTFLATCIPKDKEMKERVAVHKRARPSNWTTIEEPVNLKKILEDVKSEILIIDCLNIWLSNVIEKKWSENKILEYVKDFCLKLKEKKLITFILSNEVGLSLVSPNKTGRFFQNLLGKVNQIVAKNSDNVYFLVAGIPSRLK